MDNMGPMARTLKRLRTKKLLNSGAMKGKYYSKWHARLKQFAPEYSYFKFVRVYEMCVKQNYVSDNDIQI